MLTREDARAIAREKLEGHIDADSLLLDGATGTVDRDIGRVVLALNRQSERFTLQTLSEGADLGVLCVDFAPPQSSLRDGVYVIRLLRDRGAWVAQLRDGSDKVISLTDVQVAETGAEVDGPTGAVFGLGNLVLAVVAAAAVGFAVGVVVGVAISK